MIAARLFALAVSMVLAAGCTRVADTAAGAGGQRHPWTIPGVLRMSAASDPKSLNPVLDAGQPTGELSMFMFSYTVRYDAHADPHPDALVEIPTTQNGDVSPDGRVLRYRLRRNIKWHDGAPLTCGDLRFTWRVVMNPHNNVVTTDGYRDIASIDCSDPYVAVVHMKRLYAPFLQQLWAPNGNAAILPEHLLAKFNDARGSFNSAAYNSAPVGSGPFKFVRWDRGSLVRMAANPDFYLGAPKLKQVDFRIFPDQNTELTQLQTHDLDLIFHGNASMWDRYRAVPGVTAIHPSIYSYDHIDFNLQRPLFRDVRLREALEYAIDRKTLLQKTEHGLGDLSETDESPVIGKAYTTDTVHHPYDPAKARAILEGLGWKPGADGVRLRNGTRLSFAYSTQTESVQAHEIQTLVQRYWHDVGVDAKIKNAPTSVFFENSADGILQGGRYDVAQFAWAAAADPDDSSIYSSHNFAPHGQNALFWDDPTATRAMDDALKTVKWPLRVRDYRIVQQRIASEVPTIVLWFRQEPEIYNSDLKGLTATPVLTTPFWDTWNYSI